MSGRNSAARFDGAFTLVEMMVVLAIIAIAGAVLIPVIGRAGARAQAIACGENLRQMGIATQMYLGQWSRYPGNAATLPNGKSFSIWQPRLMVYMARNPAVFYCPAEPPSEDWWTLMPSTQASNSAIEIAGAPEAGYGYTPGEDLLNISRYASDGRYKNFSYGYNVWGTEIGGKPQLGLGTGAYMVGGMSNHQPAASAVVDPSGMIEITDREYFPNPQYPYAYEVWPSRADINPPSNVHGGCSNVLFCDGHVAAYTQTRLTELRRRDGPDAIAMNMMWNIDHSFHKPF